MIKFGILGIGRRSKVLLAPIQRIIIKNMEENIYDTIPYPNFRFTEVVNRKAKDHCNGYLYQVESFDALVDAKNIQIALNTLNTDADRIQFLIYTINHVLKVMNKHISTCKIEGCSVEPTCQELLYSLYGKLDGYGLHTDIESLTNEEINKNIEVIDQLIGKLNGLQVGQEIIFDELDTHRIESLKHDLEGSKQWILLGKKGWKTWISGVIFEYFFNKGLDQVWPHVLPLLIQINGLSGLKLLS